MGISFSATGPLVPALPLGLTLREGNAKFLCRGSGQGAGKGAVLGVGTLGSRDRRGPEAQRTSRSALPKAIPANHCGNNGSDVS